MPKRILIVDDHAAIRAGVRASLEQHPDWQVCGEAVNGLDGLHRARECCPDLVVLDVSMPVMDGLEAARHLRLTMPSVPVVLFTSHDSAQLQKYAAAAGIADVVSKDSSLVDLTTAIEKLLQPESSPYQSQSS